jgi:hypothetical protein
LHIKRTGTFQDENKIFIFIRDAGGYAAVAIDYGIFSGF